MACRFDRCPYFDCLRYSRAAPKRSSPPSQRAAPRRKYRACRSAVINKPEYAQLLTQTPDFNAGQMTMAVLTDKQLPTPTEAKLLAARYDDANPCRTRMLSALSMTRSDLVPLVTGMFTKNMEVTALLVERKITWGMQRAGGRH